MSVFFWFHCKNCCTTIKQTANPSAVGCSSGSLHLWTKLVAVGNINYQCKYCKTVVQSDNTPAVQGCCSEAMHWWVKL